MHESVVLACTSSVDCLAGAHGLPAACWQEEQRSGWWCCSGPVRLHLGADHVRGLTYDATRAGQ
jgi:hypothetical protein